MQHPCGQIDAIHDIRLDVESLAYSGDISGGRIAFCGLRKRNKAFRDADGGCKLGPREPVKPP